MRVLCWYCIWVSLAQFYSCEILIARPKNSIVVGGIPLASVEKFTAIWRPTFETYLTEAVGRQYDPPLNFVFVPLSLASAFDVIEQRTVDFIFANPSLFSCLASEFEVAPVATLRNIEGNLETSYFGGVIFTRADNNAVNNITDLRCKIVEASSILLMGSGQVQWQEMRRHGLDLLVDTAQVIFVGPDQSKIVQDVFTGKAEVGLVRSGYIEDMERSNLTLRKFFKYINLHAMSGGEDGLEFSSRELSTKLYPEWPLAATRSVGRELHLRVLNALTKITPSHPAALAARYATWVPPLSYAAVTQLNAELGIYDRAAGRCVRDGGFLELVACPPGHFRRAAEDLSGRCARLGRPCPPGYQCLCEPCQRAQEVELFLARGDSTFGACGKMQSCGAVRQHDNASLLLVDNLHRPCHHSLNLTYRLHASGSGRRRAGGRDGGRNGFVADGGVVMGSGGWGEDAGRGERLEGPAPAGRGERLEGRAVPAGRGERLEGRAVPADPSCATYEFQVRTAVRGTHVLEVFADGAQMLNSPFLLDVIARDCNGDGGGTRVADDDGRCVCAHGAVEVPPPLSYLFGGGSRRGDGSRGRKGPGGAWLAGEAGGDEGGPCVSMVQLVVAVLVPAAAALGWMCHEALAREMRRFDALWRIARSELKFDDPPVVLGHGTFGEVLRAEYRGTLVAVKHALPPHTLRRESTLRSFANPFAATKEKGYLPFADINGSRSGGNGGGGEGGAGTEFAGGRSTSDGGGDGWRGAWGSGRLAELTVGGGSPSGAARGVQAGTGGNGGRRASGLAVAAMSAAMSAGSSTRARVSQLRHDFVAEMRALARLRHPCITTVMGAVMDDDGKRGGELLLVMEYMEHGSLWNLLHNASIRLDSELALPILRDVIQGMRFLHAAQPAPIVHGDLKSANVLVDGSFRAKVADFGFSQKERAGGALGTPYWMAPELLAGEAPTVMSDVYAFGITLWEVVTRSYPYSDDENEMSTTHILAMVRAGRKRLTVPLGLRAEVESMMTDCWHQNPAHRPTFEALERRMRALDVVGFHAAAVEAMQRQSKAVLQSSRVLYEIFPRHVADALMAGRKVEPETKEMVTIFFSDIVGFTTISSVLEPRLVADMLNRLYTKLDALAAEHGVFKVETIGDAWMGVTNLVADQVDHAARIARFALDAVRAGQETLINVHDPAAGFVRIRAGFHSGPVVANVVGTRNPRYCLFGDSVNTASRMESTSRENCIHCSAQAARLVREQDSDVLLEDRGRIQVKGKGPMRTFWVRGLRSAATAAVGASEISVDGKEIDRTANSSCAVSSSGGTFGAARALSQQRRGRADSSVHLEAGGATHESRGNWALGGEVTGLVMRQVRVMADEIRELIAAVEGEAADLPSGGGGGWGGGGGAAGDSGGSLGCLQRVAEVSRGQAEARGEWAARLERMQEACVAAAARDDTRADAETSTVVGRRDADALAE